MKRDEPVRNRFCLCVVIDVRSVFFFFFEITNILKFAFRIIFLKILHLRGGGKKNKHPRLLSLRLCLYSDTSRVLSIEMKEKNVKLSVDSFASLKMHRLGI